MYSARMRRASLYGANERILVLKHAAAASGVCVTDQARVEVRVGSKEAVDNGAHLTIMAPLPMPEPMQGALLTGERIEAEDARHRSQRGFLHRVQIRVAGQG